MDLTAELDPSDLLVAPSEFEMAILAATVVCGYRANSVDMTPIVMQLWEPRECSLDGVRKSTTRLIKKGYLRVVKVEGQPSYYKLTTYGRRTFQVSVVLMIKVWKAVEKRL